jgi:hypothetical protein
VSIFTRTSRIEAAMTGNAKLLVVGYKPFVIAADVRPLKMLARTFAVGIFAVIGFAVMTTNPKML